MTRDELRRFVFFDDALSARDKAEYAVYRTGDAQDKNRTIINISHDEARVIALSLNQYIEKIGDTYGWEE